MSERIAPILENVNELIKRLGTQYSSSDIKTLLKSITNAKNALDLQKIISTLVKLNDLLTLVQRKPIDNLLSELTKMKELIKKINTDIVVLDTQSVEKTTSLQELQRLIGVSIEKYKYLDGLIKSIAQNKKQINIDQISKSLNALKSNINNSQLLLLIYNIKFNIEKLRINQGNPSDVTPALVEIQKDIDNLPVSPEQPVKLNLNIGNADELSRQIQELASQIQQNRAELSTTQQQVQELTREKAAEEAEFNRTLALAQTQLADARREAQDSKAALGQVNADAERRVSEAQSEIKRIQAEYEERLARETANLKSQSDQELAAKAAELEEARQEAAANLQQVEAAAASKLKEVNDKSLADLANVKAENQSRIDAVNVQLEETKQQNKLIQQQAADAAAIAAKAEEAKTAAEEAKANAEVRATEAAEAKQAAEAQVAAANEAAKAAQTAANEARSRSDLSDEQKQAAETRAKEAAEAKQAAEAAQKAAESREAEYQIAVQDAQRDVTKVSQEAEAAQREADASNAAAAAAQEQAAAAAEAAEQANRDAVAKIAAAQAQADANLSEAREAAAQQLKSAQESAAQEVEAAKAAAAQQLEAAQSQATQQIQDAESRVIAAQAEKQAAVEEVEKARKVAEEAQARAESNMEKARRELLEANAAAEQAVRESNQQAAANAEQAAANAKAAIEAAQSEQRNAQEMATRIQEEAQKQLQEASLKAETVQSEHKVAMEKFGNIQAAHAEAMQKVEDYDKDFDFTQKLLSKHGVNLNPSNEFIIWLDKPRKSNKTAKSINANRALIAEQEMEDYGDEVPDEDTNDFLSRRDRIKKARELETLDETPSPADEETGEVSPTIGGGFFDNIRERIFGKSQTDEEKQNAEEIKKMQEEQKENEKLEFMSEASIDKADGVVQDATEIDTKLKLPTNKTKLEEKIAKIKGSQVTLKETKQYLSEKREAITESAIADANRAKVAATRANYAATKANDTLANAPGVPDEDPLKIAVKEATDAAKEANDLADHAKKLSEINGVTDSPELSQSVNNVRNYGEKAENAAKRAEDAAKRAEDAERKIRIAKYAQEEEEAAKKATEEAAQKAAAEEVAQEEEREPISYASGGGPDDSKEDEIKSEIEKLDTESRELESVTEEVLEDERPKPIKGALFKKTLMDEVERLKEEYKAQDSSADKSAEYISKILSLLPPGSQKRVQDDFLNEINSVLRIADVPIEIVVSGIPLVKPGETVATEPVPAKLGGKFRNGVLYPGKQRGGAAEEKEKESRVEKLDKTKRYIKDNLNILEAIKERYITNYMQLFDIDKITEQLQEIKQERENKKNRILELNKDKADKKYILQGTKDRELLNRLPQEIRDIDAEIASIQKGKSDTERDVIGKYDIISNKAGKWLSEVESQIKTLKENSLNIKNNLLSFITDPQKSAQVKALFDDNFNDGKGIIDNFESYVSKLRSKYEIALQEYQSAYKSIQEGLKQTGGAGEQERAARVERRAAVREEAARAAAEREVAPEAPVAAPPVPVVEPAVKEEEKSKTNNVKLSRDKLNEIAKTDNTVVIIAKFEEGFKEILNNYLQPLYTAPENINPSMAALGVQPSLFKTLYNSYINRSKQSGDVIASEELLDQINANGINPREALKISKIDVSIFVFATLIIRMIANSVVNVLITKNKIKDITFALFAYIACYAIIFIAFVMFVNLDMYRLRIIFNYINMHSHTNLIITHLVTLAAISLVIMYLISIVNIPVMNNKTKTVGATLSDDNKQLLYYRLQIVTSISWLLVAILAFI